MKHLNTKTRFGFSILPFALCIFLILFSACDSGHDTSNEISSDTSDESSTETGSIAFSLVLEGSTSERSVVRAAALAAEFDCVASGISTVEATVYDQDNNQLKIGGPWPCGNHQGTITGVPIGDNRTVVILCKDSEKNMLYRGEKSGVSVSAGKITSAGTVTMSKIDTTAPTINSTNPTDGVMDVSINAAITATFSEKMVSASVNASSFTLMAGADTVNGVVTYDLSTLTATFTPDSNLSFFTTYTVTITTSVEDLAGNQMTYNYTWSFTTGSAPDTTPPDVNSTIPTNNATGVAVDTTITATFSETMNASSITTATFLVNNGSIVSDVTYSGTTAMFKPTSTLDYDTTYTATITTGTKDPAGNALQADYTWSFTTTVDQTLIWDDGNWDEVNWN